MSAKPVTPKVRIKHDGRHLTPRQTREVIELWEQGATTFTELSKKYGKHPDTFKRLFKRVGADFGSKKATVLEEAQEKIEEEIAAEVAETRKRIKESRDEPYRILKSITILTAHTLSKAKEENRAFGTIEKDLKALKLAAETVEIARRGRFEILGLDKDSSDDDDLPALEIIEKTDEEIRRLAAAQLSQMGVEDTLEELEEGLEDEDGGEGALVVPASLDVDLEPPKGSS